MKQEPVSQGAGIPSRQAGEDVKSRYPAHWAADGVLADGAPVQLRPVLGTDAPGLAELRSGLSTADVARLPARWAQRSPEELAGHLTAAGDPAAAGHPTITGHPTTGDSGRLAVAAVLRGRLVGTADYERIAGSDDAVVALVVEAAHRGRGLGLLLLEHLIAAARERGVSHLVADLRAGDDRALRVFHAAGFAGAETRPHTPRQDGAGQDGAGGVRVVFPTAQTPHTRGISRALEQRAEARSIARLLTPRAVAVVGASRQPGSAGHEVFRRLLASDFHGPVYPVNPAARQVASVYAYPDVREIPDAVDLAVIAVPAPAVADAVRACAEKDVRGLIVVSAGFAEAGPDGRARLAEVTRLARESGMRLIGPNAMGLINTDPAVRLHATFAAGDPPVGRVGAFTQSGALAGTFLTEASRRAIGLSTFVSTGDRSDVSANDVLQYWQSDPRTNVIMLHLQGFGNPRKFARIARRVGRRKPVIALKSGRSAADPALDALFTSAGVIRVDTLSQLFDLAALLASQPLPAGRRVGVVGTSSALAALATDACRTAGLEVPPFSTATAEALSDTLGRPEPANPVDLGAMAAPERFERALRAVAASADVDAVLALITPHPAVEELARAVRAVAGSGRVPVVASYLGYDGMPSALAAPGDGTVTPAPGSVPSFASPESAALALARAAGHAAWRSREQGVVPTLDRLDLDHARRAAAAGPTDGTWLPQELVGDILGGVGLAVWPSEPVTTAAQALDTAERLGWPVALKIADERFRGRLDVGAVRLGVEGPGALAEAWRTIRAAVGPGDMVVQPMAPAGVSTVIRMTQDPAIGPLLSLRLGGAVADLLVDPLARALPITDRDAAEMVRGIRGAVLLVGGAGTPAADTAALEDVLHRLARLAEEVPAVAEVLLDPVLVGRPGVVLLHAGVRLLPPGTDPESLPRRMTGSGVEYFR
ncbi:MULTISPECIES: acetate--CoA ligase family protein [unclassified Parafrankia]|uniref:acetate--CoA ligase family protein n=1 Tax=unclassified Parafrankia TaxID=2994368 RepID=UPI000DA42C75|nr:MULTISPECIES: acetate--CoA ligase [unclassified Parafrankia]SQD94723.1 CoA-binding domain protein [Parafrankia sp. Ea1.12]